MSEITVDELANRLKQGESLKIEMDGVLDVENPRISGIVLTLAMRGIGVCVNIPKPNIVVFTSSHSRLNQGTNGSLPNPDPQVDCALEELGLPAPHPNH